MALGKIKFSGIDADLNKIIDLALNLDRQVIKNNLSLKDYKIIDIAFRKAKVLMHISKNPGLIPVHDFREKKTPLGVTFWCEHHITSRVTLIWSQETSPEKDNDTED